MPAAIRLPEVDLKKVREGGRGAGMTNKKEGAFAPPVFYRCYILNSCLQIRKLCDGLLDFLLRVVVVNKVSGQVVGIGCHVHVAVA